MHNNSEIRLHTEAMIHFMVKVEVLFLPTYDINICSCSEVFRGDNLNGKVRHENFSYFKYNSFIFKLKLKLLKLS